MGRIGEGGGEEVSREELALCSTLVVWRSVVVDWVVGEKEGEEGQEVLSTKPEWDGTGPKIEILGLDV